MGIVQDASASSTSAGFFLEATGNTKTTGNSIAAAAITGKAILTSVTVSSTIAASTGETVVIVFTPYTSVPAGGTITLTGPATYMSNTPLVVSNVPSMKAVYTLPGTTTIVLTTSGAPTGTSAVYVTLYGATMGAANAVGTFKISTSVDKTDSETVVAPAIVAAVPVAISPSLETSTDLPVVGGRLTDGRDMAFAVSADRVPLTVNTGAVTVGFTMVNAVQVGGSVVLTLPTGYFAAVDATKSNTFTTTGAKASCSLSKLTTTTTDTVTCTIAGADLAAGAQTLTLVAGTVTTGGPTAAATYNVATSSDQQLITAPGLLSLGGTLTAGSALAFTTAANNVPGTLNTDTVTVGFTAATAVPIGGTVSLILPLNYFTAVDSSKVGTFTTTKATCTCKLTKATTATTDTVTCTVAGAAVAAVAQTLTLIAGTVTVGGPMASANTFSMQTSTDLKVTFSTFAALGSQMTNGGTVTFAVDTDKIPLTINTGLITFPGRPATALLSGASITLTLPKGYFTSIDNTKAIGFASNTGLQSTCLLNKGSASATTDTITCTTTAAVSAGATGDLVFGVGSVKTGGPMAAGTFLLATRNDLSFAAPATLALGAKLTSALILSATEADKAAGTLSAAGSWIFKFTATTVIPVGGTITLSLPNGMFASIDSSKSNTVFNNANSFLTCSLTKGATSVDRDAVVCTVTGSAITTLANGVQLIAGAVTTGLPQLAGTYSVTTSVDVVQDDPSAATLQIGGQLSALSNLFFTTAADQVPGTLNTGTVTFGFTTAASGSAFGKAIAIGGKITLVVPRGYFASVDAAKVATTSVTSCTATCALTKAVGVDPDDKITCTTFGAVIPVNTAVIITLIAGTVTTGNPRPPTTYQVSTSQDNVAATASNAAGIGGFLYAGVDMTFTNVLDQTSGKYSSNNATIQLGFTTSTAIPTGGTITLIMPPNYFSKVDATKSVTVGANGATATCTLTQSSLISNVPTTIASAVQTLGASTTLTINIVPSLISGFTQVNVPLAGFALDSSSVATCTVNCADTGAGKVTASFASGVLTLTLPYTNAFNSGNAVTTFTVTLVKNPTTAGWATNNIGSTMFRPYATVTCITATAIVTARAQTLTFPALSVTIGTAQNAGTIMIETSVDIALQIPLVAPAIAIAVTGAVKLAFSNPADAVPGRTNVGKITLGFTSANSLSIGSLVIMKFPKFYFTRVDPKAANTLTDSAAPTKSIAHINAVVGTRITSTLSCVLTPAVAPATQDTLTCTTGGSASGTGAQTVTLVPGAVTTGLSAGGGFTINTAPPPTAVTRYPYFPKAAGSTAGIAWVMAAVSVALAWL